jgi:hypothetical protein
MQRYARTFLITLFCTLAGFAGFNWLADPFAITGAPDLPGLTERDTRLYGDGGRVHVGDRLVRGGDGTILLGSSRTVDGFPHEPSGWPGGIFNAGMRGTNLYELAQAMTLAAAHPELRCVVIGLDLDELGNHAKAKPSYWLSALADGQPGQARIRVALSPNTFGAAASLIADNVSGGAPRVPWAEIYEAGAQRQRYENGARGIYRFYLGYHMDPERIDYLDRALDALTAQGIQVIGFIHPLHAWREEALFRADQTDAYLDLRATLTERFAHYADRAPADACVEGGSTTLWDFSGFQDFATLPAPSADQTAPHPTFYEPSHYSAHVGQAMLDRMRGAAVDGPLFEGAFGVRMTPGELAASTRAIHERRAAWLASADGQAASNTFDLVIAEAPTAEGSTPHYLTRDDWQTLESNIARIASQRSGR